MADRPLCKCHGVPMVSPTRWRCAIKARECDRRYKRTHPDRDAKLREPRRRWRDANREKISQNNMRRIRVGGLYLGMCGFTDKERKALLNGPSD